MTITYRNIINTLNKISINYHSVPDFGNRYDFEREKGQLFVANTTNIDKNNTNNNEYV